jgi:hypothetical protein
MYVIKLPISAEINYNKKPFYPLNLNIYRNTYFRTLNNAKVQFTAEIIPIIEDIPFMESFRLEYVLHRGSNRKVDTNNVLTVLDKFFCDCLVKAGTVPDDNCDILIETNFKIGETVKGDPHAVVTIIPL